MADEEKTIRIKTLEDFGRELRRNGDEESREGTMSLDGEATDAPITDGGSVGLSAPSAAARATRSSSRPCGGTPKMSGSECGGATGALHPWNISLRKIAPSQVNLV